MTAPIGTVESVRKVDGKTIATVRLGAPTDADVEALRRAMVEAHQTYAALNNAFLVSSDQRYHAGCLREQRALVDAARLYEDAKRARGGL